MIRSDPLTRFFAQCEPVTESGCWLWTGALSSLKRPDARPVLALAAPKRNVSAYRFAYEQLVGPIPNGLFVCHRCDVPICVNPAHLFIGTCKDNLDDMRRKGRDVVPSGSGHYAAKLSTEQVRYIRQSHPRTVKAVRAMAAEFGIKPRAIYNVLARETYKEIA